MNGEVKGEIRMSARKMNRDPRIEQTRTIVLDAVGELLLERGYVGCTVDAIVERTGVAKTTIYRHWPTRAKLLIDAVKSFKDSLPLPNTGDVRADLIEYLTLRSHKLDNTKFDLSLQALPNLIEASKQDPSLIDLPTRRTAELVQAIRKIVESGQRRRQIAKDQDLDLLANMIIGPVVLQRAFLNKKTTDKYLADLVNSVLDGASPSPG